MYTTATIQSDTMMAVGAAPETKAPMLSFEPGTKLEEIEREVILATLKHKGYNRTHAARALGIGIRTLQRKLKKYGVAGIGLKDKLINA